jgi:hypothetical protein
MPEESAVATNETPTKKLHWTQMPENKARISKIRKAAMAKRYGGDRKLSTQERSTLAIK